MQLRDASRYDEGLLTAGERVGAGLDAVVGPAWTRHRGGRSRRDQQRRGYRQRSEGGVTSGTTQARGGHGGEANRRKQSQSSRRASLGSSGVQRDTHSDADIERLSTARDPDRDLDVAA